MIFWQLVPEGKHEGGWKGPLLLRRLSVVPVVEDQLCDVTLVLL